MPLSDDQSRAFAKLYEKHRVGNHVATARAAELLGSLEESTRARIFALADLDRDGRLSMREFVYAMYLAEQAKAGKALPKAAMHHEQEEMTRAVERMLARGKDLPTTASLLPESFTTNPVSLRDADNVLDRLKQTVSNMIDISRNSDAEIDGLADEMLQARQKFNNMLLQRNQSENGLHEARKRLDDLQVTRREVEKDTSVATRRLTHLTDECEYLGIEVGRADRDLQMLLELTDNHDQYSPGGQEFSAMEIDAASVPELKEMVAKISAEKRAEQARLQKEIEKQRQIEQDRSLMVAAIEAERSKLGMLRAERMKLCEERSGVEKEMTNMAQRHWELLHTNDKPRGGARQGAQQPSHNPPVRGIRTAGQSPVVYAAYSSTAGQQRSPLGTSDPRANVSVFGVPMNRSSDGSI